LVDVLFAKALNDLALSNGISHNILRERALFQQSVYLHEWKHHLTYPSFVRSTINILAAKVIVIYVYIIKFIKIYSIQLHDSTFYLTVFAFLVPFCIISFQYLFALFLFDSIYSLFIHIFISFFIHNSNFGQNDVTSTSRSSTTIYRIW